jgi:hypothetical protein
MRSGSSIRGRRTARISTRDRLGLHDRRVLVAGEVEGNLDPFFHRADDVHELPLGDRTRTARDGDERRLRCVPGVDVDQKPERALRVVRDVRDLPVDVDARACVLRRMLDQRLVIPVRERRLLAAAADEQQRGEADDENPHRWRS